MAIYFEYFSAPGSWKG